MTDLPAQTRKKLDGAASFSSVIEINHLASRNGATKALLILEDGNTIETALLPSSKAGGYTACVSSQVGCPVGCCFCVTGNQGFKRNLSVAEIVDQVLYFARRLEQECRIMNIVFMGMGEPLANYDNVIEAIKRFNAPWGLALRARSITISTVGLVPGIEKLAKEEIQVGLAVSLHAADDKLRTQLVPMNKKYPLVKLMPAVRQYIKATGRRVSFEYCLIDSINDGLNHARALAHLIQGMNVHVNLISMNPGCSGYNKPKPKKIIYFKNELEKWNGPINAAKFLCEKFRGS